MCNNICKSNFNTLVLLHLVEKANSINHSTRILQILHKYRPILFIVGLEINIEEADYYIIENDESNPGIELQFRRTQSSFTMTIFPVSIVDLNQRFSFTAEDFIDIPVIPEAIATAGELLSLHNTVEGMVVVLYNTFSVLFQ